MFQLAFAVNQWQSVLIVLLGLVAGVLGGMLGVGGSTLMIPGLVFLFGQQPPPGPSQHVYQAAAMIANVAVSVPAALRHYRKGATTTAALQWMLPAALVTVLLGVWLSNLSIFEGEEGGIWLGRLLALFLVYVIYVNVRRLGTDRIIADTDLEPHVTAPRSALIGGAMGMIAGLLGIGGGAIAVPLQQVLMRLPLRACIANSAAIICISAAVGAVYKNATLSQLGFHWRDSLILALMLAPSCWLGGHLGASLTHRLPIRQVRLAFIILMIAAAVKMADIT